MKNSNKVRSNATQMHRGKIKVQSAKVELDLHIHAYFATQLVKISKEKAYKLGKEYQAYT